MGIASYFEDIQDARGEPEKEQPYRTAREWLEKVRPYLDEFEKSLSEKELLDRVRKTLISLSRQKRARPKKDDSRDVMMWQVFVRGSSTNKGSVILNKGPYHSDGDETFVEPSASYGDRNSIKVYITRTGKKYHTDDCEFLEEYATSKIPIYLDEAQEDYGPCGVCNPPR